MFGYYTGVKYSTYVLFCQSWVMSKWLAGVETRDWVAAGILVTPTNCKYPLSGRFIDGRLRFFFLKQFGQIDELVDNLVNLLLDTGRRVVA
jgi:hypothetical protein